MKKVFRTDEEWRQLLEPQAYAVAREAGTERAFSGRYWDHHESGRYHCVCCNLELFDSTSKFDSGSGWPSFFAALKDEYLVRLEDRSHLMVRTEILCARCDAHLGHLFGDGPPPTGLRYCINSAALKFVAEKGESAAPTATE